MKKSMVAAIRTVSAAAALSAGVLLSLCPVGCKTSVEGLELLTGDFTVPALTEYAVTGATEVTLAFSKPVRATFLSIGQVDDGDVLEQPGQPQHDAQGQRLTVTTQQPLQVGKDYVLTGEIEDANGNTLTFSVPLHGFNDHVARLALSEVRTVKSGKNTQFVEFYVLQAGNLSGLEFVDAYKGGQRSYAFPAIEVEQGEYIVLHLQRTADATTESGFVASQQDELGPDLALTGKDWGVDTARDLWAQTTESHLGKTDILVLRNSNDNSVMDALVYRTTKNDSQWKASYAEYAAMVEQSGAWLDADGTASCTLETALVIDAVGSSATKSLSRKNVRQLAGRESPYSSADEWYVTEQKGATPGLPNGK